jgi:hypothetical protein
VRLRVRPERPEERRAVRADVLGGHAPAAKVQGHQPPPLLISWTMTGGSGRWMFASTSMPAILGLPSGFYLARPGGGIRPAAELLERRRLGRVLDRAVTV